MNPPPEALVLARRALDRVQGVIDVGNWRERNETWVLEILLSRTGPPSAMVPADTRWQFEVEGTYPRGDIAIFPATGGLEATFQHQRHNGPSKVPGRRSGKLCVQNPGFVHGRLAPRPEPFTTKDRLAWHVGRALDWLHDAARDALAPPGAPFELPDFPDFDSDGLDRVTVAFLEDSSSMARWSGMNARFGLARVLRYGRVRLVSSFSDSKGREFAAVDWGKLAPIESEEAAIWFRLGSVPVRPPWEAPTTFEALDQCAPDVGGSIRSRIAAIASEHPKLLRSGRPPLLLLGFPIPRNVGLPPERLHWQAARLPVLSTGKSTGFRTDVRGLASRDREVVLRPRLAIAWQRSENWCDDELTVRGSISAPTKDSRIAILGAGALGSALAELLVRGGARHLALLDAGIFRAGNAVRHELTLADVGRSKAHRLASRLHQLSPHARVLPFAEHFPPITEGAKQELAAAQWVVDATGEDDVLALLGAFAWSGGARLASFSIGYGAKRLFAYYAPLAGFSFDAFQKHVTPLLDLERAEQKEPLPMGGIGCWHPAFPARQDDVWLLASCGLKHWESRGGSSRFAVFERMDDGGFSGVRLEREEDL